MNRLAFLKRMAFAAVASALLDLRSYAVEWPAAVPAPVGAPVFMVWDERDSTWKPLQNTRTGDFVRRYDAEVGPDEPLIAEESTGFRYGLPKP